LVNKIAQENVGRFSMSHDQLFVGRFLIITLHQLDTSLANHYQQIKCCY